MPFESIQIPRQDHTLACMIRDLLFENGAEYAACTVLHPQDDFLHVEIRADDCKDVLLSSLRQARGTLEGYIKTIRATAAHAQAANEL